ncbi:glutathione S-transferase family protein [Telmatospirillum sp. J64-1]|uniref:glutathione S-transferase family protein n=1 Tax=Telmatospirillum sp. J64-1 TaxID=2502183 RepID=UPI001C8F2593|nr:glutathione S-transferase family protein [Telmatospirillum sp. J64-1]
MKAAAPYRLYETAPSGNCWKVRLCLAELGLPHERVTLDLTDRERLAGLSRHRRVPVLIAADGRPIVESAAILVYLARGSSLLPETPSLQAEILSWLFWEQADLSKPLALPRFFRRMGWEQARAAEIAALRQEGARHLSFLENWLAGRPYLTGAEYTLADLACHVYVHLAPEGGQDLSAYPAVGAWLDRIRARPAWQPL